MANIGRKNPGRPTSFGGAIDQLFQENLGRWIDDGMWSVGNLHNRNVPVNIRETDKTYEVEVMAPGLKKEDFQLHFSNNTLTISFDHKEEKTEEGEDNRWLRKEYRQQSFTRSFSIDDTVDVDKATARYDNGVLYLTLPKKEHAQSVSKTINVQ